MYVCMVCIYIYNQFKASCALSNKGSQCKVGFRSMPRHRAGECVGKISGDVSDKQIPFDPGGMASGDRNCFIYKIDDGTSRQALTGACGKCNVARRTVAKAVASMLSWSITEFGSSATLSCVYAGVYSLCFMPYAVPLSMVLADAFDFEAGWCRHHTAFHCWFKGVCLVCPLPLC